MLGTGVEDFVSWVAPISSLPPAKEEEDEEDEMTNLIHNFGARKRKQVPVSSGRLMLPPRLWVRLIDTQLAGV